MLNLSTPSEPFEAATKEYVDNVNNNIDKRPHLIAATASYHGDLIKGEYQFTFGGNSNQTYRTHWKYNGFLMPQNGYIKRFVLEDFGLKFFYDDNGVQTTFLIFIEKTFGFNVPVPLFTLVLFKTGGQRVDLGTINIVFDFRRNDLQEIELITEYSFTSNLYKEAYKINMKDIINIRSELSNTFNVENPHFYSSINKRNYVIDRDNFTNEFYTYLATILIELDPL